jgi:glycine dehydrogenase subunit 1
MGRVHRYIPASDDERQEMLEAIGLATIDDLFASIPERLRLKGRLDLPGPLSEIEIVAELEARAAANRLPSPELQFLGGGAYRHAVPAVVDHLISRTEFYSSYTPYQPEISQGTLQAMFEYQTLLCQLTELPIANASMYEGGSAVAEAILMTERMSPKDRVVVSDLVHPEYLQVTTSHLQNLDIATASFGHRDDGTADLEAARAALAGGASALVIQQPNFFGCLEDVEAAARLARESGAHLIVAVAEPVALGILKGPGRQGADVVAGEGQSLGVPLSYGGPYLGFLAARQPFLRNMPGRIVGEARDADGRRGYVLTLSTREQHIRREKATSNICTNEGLMALAAAITMAALGKAGLREMAEHSHAKAVYARQAIAAARRCRLVHAAPCFNEFVVELPVAAEEAVGSLAGRGLIAGIPLSRYFAGRERQLLVAVTEINTRASIDRLAAELARLG